MNFEDKHSDKNTTSLDNSNIQCSVNTPARVAIYDDFKSSPRIIEIEPKEPKDFIGELAAVIYGESQKSGGKIAYSVIKQITENLIHARFKEIVVSIFPGGKEIRFSDQGPGIKNKEDVFRPGFSTATHEMKKYIDGVGSGLPIAKEYLESNHGEITIENNLDAGVVITLKEEKNSSYRQNTIKLPNTLEIDNSTSKIVSKRQESIMRLLAEEEIAGNKQISESLGIPQSSVHNELSKLEQMKYVKKVGTKRALTALGKEITESL